MQKILTAVAVATLAACASRAPVPATDPAALSITGEDLLRHVAVLSSDRFEGRLPGTRGETLTVNYLTEQFRELGLAPGNPDGSYVQKVPLVGITGEGSATLRAGKRALKLKAKRDYVVSTSRFIPNLSVKNSELVFVGYGVQAPEYGWDDYKGLDVRGKTLVMLINDPYIPGDDQLFKGKAMTYYGRWTYKYDIASKLGASGAIIIHEDGPAGYPWAVVQNGWTGEQFELAAKNENADRVPVQSWITLDTARALFSGAGQDFDTLKAAALSKDFQPVRLDARADFTIRNQVRRVQSRNVVALIPGSDPALKDELVIYGAHWDHMGRDRSLKGDQIYNGAVDNATGTAALIEIAQAYQQLPVAPRRSILFLAVTAEEQGLLGSAHYAANPLYPLKKTVAMINMDALNPWGPTRDVQVIGMGQNTLEDVLKKAARERGRVLVGDTQTEKGFYYRSDQFNFAKVGVPALYADGGVDLYGQPAGTGERLAKEYTANDYHKPSDEIKPGWDLSGAAADLQLLFETGRRVANSDERPGWKPGSEFKAIHEALLARP